jgi:hypothetical protein
MSRIAESTHAPVREKVVHMSEPEFEMLEGVPEMFEMAEAEAAELQAGAAVENDAAVREMAAVPDIAAGEQAAVQQSIATNPYVQKLWDFAKWAGKTTAGASAAFGIMYGLNKAAAEKAQSSGQRTGLSSYLEKAKETFTKKGLTWTQEQEQKAAEDALSYPWIDATQ